MLILVLLGVLLLVVAGCICVVWAGRGGPRWVRGVAAVTLAAGEVVRRAEIGRGRGSKGNNTTDGDSLGS